MFSYLLPISALNEFLKDCKIGPIVKEELKEK